MWQGSHIWWWVDVVPDRGKRNDGGSARRRPAAAQLSALFRFEQRDEVWRRVMVGGG
ncbi:hypothetical protein HanRHA438_Chr10g0451011 [Helianthus annuus]|nr:hypothetical protein HanRHA438_Chr10g0451011 [Helianthus annuus]